MLRSALAICVLTIIVPQIPAQTLDDHREGHQKAVVAAKQKLLIAMQDVVAEYVANGKSNAGAVTEYMQLFESRGVLGIGDESLFDDYRKYGASLKVAGDKLKEAYLAEIKVLQQMGDSAEATALLEELLAQRLPNDLVSLQCNRSKHYLKHFALEFGGGEMRFPSDRLNAILELTPGLSDGAMTSIRAGNWPDSYVDHHGFRIRLTPHRDDLQWKEHATWYKVGGLADEKNGVSFRSASHPDRYLCIRANGEAWLDPVMNTEMYRTSATFYVKKPLFKLW